MEPKDPARLANLTDHISLSLGIPLNQRSDDLKILKQPLVALDSPVLSYQCPSCLGWYFAESPRWQGLSVVIQSYTICFYTHLKKSTLCGVYWGATFPDWKSGVDTLVKRYVQEVFPKSMVKKSTRRVPLAEGWSPTATNRPGPDEVVSTWTLPQDRVQRVPAQAPPHRTDEHEEDRTIECLTANETTPFLESVGWFAWFNATAADARDVLKLVKTPQSVRQGHSHEQYIEKGLRRILDFTKQYLMDANHFVASHNHQIRDALTAGYV
jgi:hypothetical protein